MNNIACCYLTHNHPDTVKEILDKSLKEYMEHNIDICIYDDSTNNDTKNLIERYISEGATGLHYVDAHEVENGDEKMIMILQGRGLPEDYEYIWPSKDRVCFSGSFLDKVCDAVEKGYDVIQAANEFQRWDVRYPTSKDEYTDAGEFYRNYIVYMTNWEGTIRKRSTMLKHVDWELYRNNYGLDSNNPFFHSLSVMVRILEMDGFRGGIVRFEKNERYISGTYGSSWENHMFNLWIDRWVAANYALPSVLDPYKFDAIRSQTGLPELFGSAEGMMDFNGRGLYDEEIFNKYRNLWPLITDMPLDWLSLISTGRYQEVIMLTVEAFEKALSEHDYLWALRLISTNMWFSEMYDDETYNIMCICFHIFKQDMISKGYSHMFSGVDSVDGIVDRYKVLTSR